MIDVDLIVIGGSAGALPPLRRLVGALPATTPPIAAVVHIGVGGEEGFAAALCDIGCALDVAEAEDKDIAAPGTLRLAPAGYHLLVERGGWYSLSNDEPVQFARPSIDVLFTSAAWAYGPRVLGIVLSGANRDGADGLACIRRRGGRCWVQRPEEAAYPAMPTAAAPYADELLSVDAMIARLADPVWSGG